MLWCIVYGVVVGLPFVVLLLDGLVCYCSGVCDVLVYCCLTLYGFTGVLINVLLVCVLCGVIGLRFYCLWCSWVIGVLLHWCVVYWCMGVRALWVYCCMDVLCIGVWCSGYCCIVLV